MFTTLQTNQKISAAGVSNGYLAAQKPTLGLLSVLVAAFDRAAASKSVTQADGAYHWGL